MEYYKNGILNIVRALRSGVTNTFNALKMVYQLYLTQLRILLLKFGMLLKMVL